MAEVLHIFRALVHRFPMEELGEAELIYDKGLAGCIHGRKQSQRQVLLMASETLQDLGLAPGVVKENITTAGLELRSLSAGYRIEIGEAILEVTEECHPCERMEEIRPGLREKLRGRRGILCRVVTAGKIRKGNSIQPLAPAEGAAASQGTGQTT